LSVCETLQSSQVQEEFAPHHACQQQTVQSMPIHNLSAALLALCTAVSACGGGSDATAATNNGTNSPTVATVERDISPGTVESASTQALNAHVAINPGSSVGNQGRLYLHLHGTGGVAGNSRLVLRHAASLGFHALGISYPSEPTVNSLCSTSADADCLAKTRRERILGEDTSPLVSVNPADAVVPRLQKTLAYLHQQFPQEAWGQFLNAGQINWALVHVGGHSQGAGHAAFLSKLYPLAAACLFSGPGDNLPNGAPAPWLSQASATALGRLRGFVHTQDELLPLAQVQSNWRALGLDASGAATNIDNILSSNSAWPASQQWLTSASPDPLGAGPISRHGLTVVDRNTPKTASGSALFAPVWTQLCLRVE
jgi:hypothetical protein